MDGTSRAYPALVGFSGSAPGTPLGMNLALLLIVIGIILAVLVNYGLGIVCILIGLVLLLWPRLRTSF
jgi:Zn-dependent membrane protease YugP